MVVFTFFGSCVPGFVLFLERGKGEGIVFTDETLSNFYRIAGCVSCETLSSNRRIESKNSMEAVANGANLIYIFAELRELARPFRSSELADRAFATIICVENIQLLIHRVQHYSSSTFIITLLYTQ